MAIGHHTIPQFSDKQIQFFWSHINIGLENECWIWNGSIDSDGYGRTWFFKKCFRAHRIAYFLHYQKDPNRLLVLHDCDNPPCVNPTHLFLGTTQDNTADMMKKGRQAKGDRSSTRLNPQCIHKGESHWKAKLTEEQVREIRKDFAVKSVNKTRFCKQTAPKYGISRQMVYFIVSYINWKHI